jgi:hypothetical protein
MERLGHRSFSTSLGYIRRGRQLARAFSDVSPSLPECLLGTPATRIVPRCRNLAERWRPQRVSAQCETVRNALESAASEALAELIAKVRLVG